MVSDTCYLLITCIADAVRNGLFQGVETVAGGELLSRQADALPVVVNEQDDRVCQLLLFRAGPDKLVTVQKVTGYGE